MRLGTFRHGLFTLVTLAAFCHSLAASATPSLGAIKDSSEREFYSSNRENRFLVRIHVWGDTPLSGIHYVPDNTTLLDLMGLTGGLSSGLDDTNVTILRQPEKGKGELTELKVGGRDLVTKPEYRDAKILAGDVVYVKGVTKDDTFMRTLGIIGTVLGVISASAGLYLLATR